MRIDKLIEERLATSRKEMKRLFQQGKVLVDQQIERNPSRMSTVDCMKSRLLGYCCKQEMCITYSISQRGW